MDLVTALDEAIENVIRCALDIEDSEGTAAATARLARVRTLGIVHRLMRKHERECKHMEERRMCTCELPKRAKEKRL